LSVYLTPDRRIKLTETDVLDIRLKWLAGASQTALAREYGIASSNAHRLCHGKQRKDAALADDLANRIARRGCSVEGCASPHYGRGYCRNHYEQWQRRQQPGRSRQRPRRPQPPITTYPGEIWKPVVGHEEAYAVSNIGRVKSLERNITDKNGKTKPACGRLLKPQSSGQRGYLTVTLCGRIRYVHNLVLTTFIGPRPLDLECRHLNGINTDNRIENLRWGTHKENAEDRIRHRIERMLQTTNQQEGSTPQ
jgi:hypothetical protein